MLKMGCRKYMRDLICNLFATRDLEKDGDAYAEEVSDE